MTPAFLRAVVDTLIPGETAPGEPGLPALPSGSAVGIDPAPHVTAHHIILGAIAARAGGEDGFANADEAARVQTLKSIEQEQPDEFRALVTALWQDYYESAPVLAAMGWRAEPPQPNGHRVPQSDTTSDALLARAKRQARLWRE
ncbi:MAG: hypothetical protein ACREEE_02980 [Dongiaceae bacterium]